MDTWMYVIAYTQQWNKFPKVRVEIMAGISAH